MLINECVGPRWVRKRNSKSTSGRMDAARRRGRFILTWASLAEPFPSKYPKAKWPIANVFTERLLAIPQIKISRLLKPNAHVY
jgi:hypothetical protein